MPDRKAVALTALREMKDLRGRPVNLSATLSDWSNKVDLDQPIVVSELLEWIKPGAPFVALRQHFHGMVSIWDYHPEFDWSSGTEPSSEPRRRLICNLLGLSTAESDEINRLFPVYPTIDQPIKIKAGEEGAPNWYDRDRRDRNVYYWRAYERYLISQKGWDPKNVAVLDSTSTDVISDLQDPLGKGARTTRGLVVGYVQSGKTANFTGVIAKAIDAGYRLVIVLAGLQNTLRNQTQRRIDKELVGREILELSGEYVIDDDWADFNRHGDMPERDGAFNIDRLTTSTQDFRNPIGDLSRLRFHKSEPSLPFNDERNLARHPAKLIVIKKNKVPLSNLLMALRQAELAGTPWTEVPSIIIDDESDQASLNAKKPSVNEIQERTAINKLIVETLSVLKRGQYVGYTATPFANVFVNPDDAEDLFPSDFILSLPRSDGYMGVQDFYDSRETPKTFPNAETNFGCYVRPVVGADGEKINLPRAVDAFVLSGAVKLFREAREGRKYRHHTMLVHLTTSVNAHTLLRDRIVSMFDGAGYASGGDGFSRLKDLWNSDYKLICDAERHRDGPVPATFSELGPFIGGCVAKIAGDGACTLILNGNDREEAPDFDKTSVWKIIVGGAKLSRGYTLEGLTVSYYRRVAGAADTLMQMGRWFGYREGYRDLVRLYIGTDEAKGKSERVDLYEAFRGVCDDEEEFRSQLALYSRLKGDERLTPRQVPPLVPSHVLLPTARNKMYNATILFVNFGGEQKQSTVASTDPDIKRLNATAMSLLLKSAPVKEGIVQAIGNETQIKFKAFAGLTSSEDMISFLHKYKFGEAPSDQGQLFLIREFLAGMHGDPKIRQWVIVAPQFTDQNEGKVWLADGVGRFSIRRRERVGDAQRRYNVFTESLHVDVAKMIAGISADLHPGNEFTKSLVGDGHAVLLLYPVCSRAETDEIPTMGFSLIFPKNQIGRRIRYGVRVKDRPADVTVDA